VLGRHPAKLAMCEKWNIAARNIEDVLSRHDQDVVVDCTGSSEGLEQALGFVRPRGTVVLKTTAAAGRAMNLSPVVINEVSIVGSRCGPFRDAIDALAKREVDVVSLIHRRMKLEQGVEAMQLAGQRGVMKVLLSVNS
jgi:threonine dehydrogenase-like Zn-dependent dehydrogenase